MKEIYQTSQFKKDFKRAKKRGKDIDKLKDVVGLIIKDQPLSERHRDHGLWGSGLGHVIATSNPIGC